MKVCFICPTKNRIYLDLFREFNKIKGVDFKYFTSAEDLEKEWTDTSNGFPMILLPSHSKPGYFLHRYRDKLIGLERELESFKPDVVLVNGFYRPASIQGANWAVKNDVPFVLFTEVQAYTSMLMKCGLHYLKRLMFDKASSILPWTRRSQAFVQALMGKDSCRQRLEPGIDTKLFKPRKVKKKPSLSILMVARMIDWKNQEDLLRATEKLISEGYKDFKIYFLGEGLNKEKLERIVYKERLGAFVEFLDKVQYEKMPELYSQFDVLVLPSTREPVGRVVPEAMACGVIPVVSDTCGAEQYVVEGVNGYVFNTKDYEGLAFFLSCLMDEGLREIMSSEAMQTIKEGYDCKLVAKKLHNMLKEVLDVS